MEKLSLIWKNIYESVAIEEEQKLTFELMMTDTNLEKIDDSNKLMVITTKNKIAEVIIKNDFYNLLINAINKNYLDYKLEIFYKDEYSKNKKNNKEEKIEIKTKDNYEPNERFTFDNFIASKDNKLLYKAAITISKNRSKSWNPFFIHGKSGLGKTHILHAIANNAKEQKSYKSIKYIEAKDFGQIVVRATISGDRNVDKNLEEIKNEFLNYDLLLVDDIQFIQNRNKTKEIFFSIFDNFIKSDKKNKQIVVASDQEPEDLVSFEERFITRFKKGLLLGITPPDKETAIEILKMKIKNLEGLNEIKIKDDAVEWIAVNYGKNVRFLEGALNKLLLFSINEDKNDFEINLSDVVNIFKESNSINKHITKENIIFTISKYFGISKSDLLGPTRKKEIVFARNISIYLIRELMNDSLIEIGRFFKRDHSTIIVSLNKTKNTINTNIKLNETIQEIKKML
ncbi:MAG: chromosomal replication initiator protein DnaA [Candidatus Hepatoplasma vulgare]|nr:MAG: chromosomal replication initiator protein DnaA [Candidatus Hepatoplasma sp.]